MSNELSNAPLGDERLSRRLVRLAEALAAQPEASIPKATGNWGQACAAYRFLDHTSFKPQDILQPHLGRTLARAATEATVLAIADTTSLNFGECPQTQGLGLIGNRAEKFFGLWLQSLLAVTPQGLPLGLLDMQCWARDPANFGGNHQRNRKPVAAKESAKWLRSYQALSLHCGQTPKTRWIMLSDREGDLYELLALATAGPAELVVRAQHDRGLEKSTRRLFAQLRGTPMAGPLQVKVPRRSGQAARTANLSIRFRPVQLSAPWLKADQPTLKLWAVEAREAHPPSGHARVHWRLLTTCPVETLAQAREVIGWYALRWRIEVFHKVLKSACRVETTQLETAERLKNYLALKLVIAWQVMALTHQSRGQPDVQVHDILEATHWQVLQAATKTSQPTRPPTLRQAIQRLAQLGGHLGRRHDGPPGPLCLARGLQRLHDITLGWKLAQQNSICA